MATLVGGDGELIMAGSSEVLATPNCPACNGIEKVTKVSAVVLGGTTIAAGTSVQPRLQAGGDGWAVDVTDTSSTSRTALAALLSFPSKGEALMGWAWGLLVVCVIMAIGAGVDKSSVEKASSPRADQIDFDVNVMAAAIILGILLLFGAIAATDWHLTGRTRAKERWGLLYYCGRDDLVFLTSRPDVAVPPGGMRTLLEY